MVFEEVAQYSLKMNDNYGVIEFVGPALEVMAVGPFEKFISLRVHL